MGIYRFKRDGRKYLAIKLGTGDVSVGTSPIDSPIQAIAFSVIDTPVGIGDSLSLGASGNNPMTYLSFDNLESFEVVERAMKKIRSQLEARAALIEYLDD